MPKTIELTIEIAVQRVSCPGVWLCQDGGVSLIVFALGTSYETCMLPPTFPLQFNDKLYFRKRFLDTCALSNMCCLLKDETLYCELVQWGQSCDSGQCNVLAQYLGSLSDILFPPTMCCNDGVDLLMRRSKFYPGILSPKIEIATKVRIDEVWNDKDKPHSSNIPIQSLKNSNCGCMPLPGSRQKPVCHSSQYHRNMCPTVRPNSRSRSRSRSRGSNCSIGPAPNKYRCKNTDPACKRPTLADSRRRRDLCVFNMRVNGDEWNNATSTYNGYDDNEVERIMHPVHSSYNEDKKMTFESRYVDDDMRHTADYEDTPTISDNKTYGNSKPCTCEICRRYHELFHAGSDADAHVS